MRRVNSFSWQWPFHTRRLSRYSGVFFFFGQFCDHPQLDLAKFGYRSKKRAKVEFFSKPLLYTWDLENLNLYVLNMANSTLFSLKIWRLWANFSKIVAPSSSSPSPKKPFHQQSRKSLGHPDSQKCVELLELGGEAHSTPAGRQW